MIYTGSGVGRSMMEPTSPQFRSPRLLQRNIISDRVKHYGHNRNGIIGAAVQRAAFSVATVAYRNDAAKVVFNGIADIIGAISKRANTRYHFGELRQALEISIKYSMTPERALLMGNSKGLSLQSFIDYQPLNIFAWKNRYQAPFEKESSLNIYDQGVFHEILRAYMDDTMRMYNSFLKECKKP